MSQKIEDKADTAGARTYGTRGFMQQVRVAARRKYTSEEKVHIVLEGFRWEVAVKGSLSPGRNQAGSLLILEQGLHRSKEGAAYPFFAYGVDKTLTKL